jgi:hypothetical protein
MFAAAFSAAVKVFSKYHRIVARYCIVDILK